MASNLDLAQYIADQCAGAGDITFKKMFGEYGFYCNGKFFACLSDDKFFVKSTDAGRALVPEAPLLPAYEGAKNSLYIENVDDHELLVKLTKVTCKALPEPKMKNHPK